MKKLLLVSLFIFGLMVFADSQQGPTGGGGGDGIPVDGSGSPTADISWDNFGITDLSSININGYNIQPGPLAASNLQIESVSGLASLDIVPQNKTSKGNYVATQIFGYGQEGASNYEVLFIGFQPGGGDNYRIQTLKGGDGIIQDLFVGAPNAFGGTEATIEFKNSTNEIIAHGLLKASNDLEIANSGSQVYKINSQFDWVYVQGQEVGKELNFLLASADDDGTDDVLLYWSGRNWATTSTNAEYARIGVDADEDEFVFETAIGAGGTVYPMSFKIAGLEKLRIDVDNIVPTADIIPSSPTLSLGSSSNRWGSIYLSASGNFIDFDGVTINKYATNALEIGPGGGAIIIDANNKQVFTDIQSSSGNGQTITFHGSDNTVDALSGGNAGNTIIRGGDVTGASNDGDAGDLILRGGSNAGSGLTGTVKFESEFSGNLTPYTDDTQILGLPTKRLTVVHTNRILLGDSTALGGSSAGRIVQGETPLTNTDRRFMQLDAIIDGTASGRVLQRLNMDQGTYTGDGSIRGIDLRINVDGAGGSGDSTGLDAIIEGAYLRKVAVKATASGVNNAHGGVFLSDGTSRVAGVFGVADSDASDSAIGGYFRIDSDTTDSSQWSNDGGSVPDIEAALVADGGDSGSDIFIARDDSGEVFSVNGDGVAVTKEFGHTGTTFGIFSQSPTTQPTKVNDPSGGLVIDSECRAVVEEMIDKLEAVGIFSDT